LHARNVKLEEREYGKAPLSEKELRQIIGEDPITDFLNTRTPLYRARNMKAQPPSKDEAIALMLRDQNLLRRPILIKGRMKVVGLNETAMNELL
jgi:arsenate reductase-like glutaredoxin family protein